MIKITTPMTTTAKCGEWLAASKQRNEESLAHVREILAAEEKNPAAFESSIQRLRELARDYERVSAWLDDVQFV